MKTNHMAKKIIIEYAVNKISKLITSTVISVFNVEVIPTEYQSYGGLKKSTNCAFNKVIVEKNVTICRYF